MTEDTRPCLGKPLVEPVSDELVRLRKENLELRMRHLDMVSPERLSVWLADKNRRPAYSAFTAGPERDLARALEDAMDHPTRPLVQKPTP